MKPTQPELALESPDSRTETVWVDEFAAAAAKLRANGFRVDSWTWVHGKGQYIVHATRINRPGPELEQFQ